MNCKKVFLNFFLFIENKRVKNVKNQNMKITTLKKVFLDKNK